jgi:ribosomal protein S12
MSHGTVMPAAATGPATLAWSEKAKAEVAEALARYPVKRSAVLPVRSRSEGGRLPTAALRLVAGWWIARIRLGIATFYTMFNMKLGRHHLQVHDLVVLAGGGRPTVPALKGWALSTARPRPMAGSRVPRRCLARAARPCMQVGLTTTRT